MFAKQTKINLISEISKFNLWKKPLHQIIFPNLKIMDIYFCSNANQLMQQANIELYIIQLDQRFLKNSILFCSQSKAIMGVADLIIPCSIYS